MTKKDLFKIVLKLYGLYSVLELLVQLPMIIFYISKGAASEVDWTVFMVPAMSLVLIFILLFQPGIVVDLFKLDKGFDNEEGTAKGFDGKGLVKVGLIIIGVYFVVSNLGTMIVQIFNSFKASVSRQDVEHFIESINPNPFSYEALITSGLYVLIGLLLLTNHARLSLWIEKINSKNAR